MGIEQKAKTWTTTQINALIALAVGAIDALYAKLLGRAGGQTLSGGTLAGESLTLRGSQHANNGPVNIVSTALVVKTGAAVRIQDPADTSLTDLTQTATELLVESKVTGADGDISALPKGAGALKLLTGKLLKIYDSLNTSYTKLTQTATELTLESVVTGADGAIRLLPKGAGAVEVRTGKTLKILNAANGEYTTITEGQYGLEIKCEGAGDRIIRFTPAGIGQVQIREGKAFIMYSSSNRSTSEQCSITEERTIPNGAGATVTLTNLCPANSVVKSVGCIITQAGDTTTQFNVQKTGDMGKIILAGIANVAGAKYNSIVNGIENANALLCTKMGFPSAVADTFTVTPDHPSAVTPSKLRFVVFYEQISPPTS